MGSQYTEKANATLVVTCVSCGREVSTSRTDSVGLQFRDRNGLPQVVAVCLACHEQGWRPKEYTGF